MIKHTCKVAIRYNMENWRPFIKCFANGPFVIGIRKSNSHKTTCYRKKSTRTIDIKVESEPPSYDELADEWKSVIPDFPVDNALRLQLEKHPEAISRMIISVDVPPGYEISKLRAEETPNFLIMYAPKEQDVCKLTFENSYNKNNSH